MPYNCYLLRCVSWNCFFQLPFIEIIFNPKQHLYLIYIPGIKRSKHKECDHGYWDNNGAGPELI
jgi:hypothetical protein